jgi:hypothetical protein
MQKEKKAKNTENLLKCNMDQMELYQNDNLHPMI